MKSWSQNTTSRAVINTQPIPNLLSLVGRNATDAKTASKLLLFLISHFPLAIRLFLEVPWAVPSPLTHSILPTTSELLLVLSSLQYWSSSHLVKSLGVILWESCHAHINIIIPPTYLHRYESSRAAHAHQANWEQLGYAPASPVTRMRTKRCKKKWMDESTPPTPHATAVLIHSLWYSAQIPL